MGDPELELDGQEASSPVGNAAACADAVLHVAATAELALVNHGNLLSLLILS